jgi:Lar family restriction alleviation protein
MTEELLPCPFCGSTDITIRRTLIGLRQKETARRYWCECQECGAAGPNNQYQSGAVKAWNTRVEKEKA